MDSELTVVDRILTVIAIVALILLCCTSSHCLASSPKHNNGLGVLISGDNPYEYNVGVVAHGVILTDAKDREYTSIDFAPYGGPMLFPEEILLCGDQSGPLTEHRLKVVVLTYERQAHQMYQGVACHILRSVNEVKEP